MSVMLLPGKGQQNQLKRELLRQRPVPAHLQTVCILNFITGLVVQWQLQIQSFSEEVQQVS